MATYEVLARKWRPRRFDDVIGQEHVTRTLKNAIESGRIAHAYLFVGSRGIGKTTLSRIFAKALNCSHGDKATAEPCGECENCREIMAGSSLDVIEIDAASNNGVDNIRDIRDAAAFAPSNSRYKVFIIDEVHMLSQGAFNALLKMLEEPPGHVKFVFATTEFDKLPSTIVSRCQRFDLRRISTALIVERLRKICRSEGVEASDDALLAIARGAEGGMRDALSALDQIISFRGNSVTEEDVVSVFGLVPREQIEALAGAALRGDMGAGLKIIDSLDKDGKDLRRLVLELLLHFRNLIVRKQLGKEALALLDLTPDQIRSLDAQTGLADTARLIRIAEHFASLEDRIRFALSRRTLFETVFLRCCRASSTATIDSLIQRLAKLKDKDVSLPAGFKEEPVLSAPPPVLPVGGQEPRKDAVQDGEALPQEPSRAPEARDQPREEEIREEGESLIRAADEPHIKEILKVFDGKIVSIEKTAAPYRDDAGGDDRMEGDE